MKEGQFEDSIFEVFEQEIHYLSKRERNTLEEKIAGMANDEIATIRKVKVISINRQVDFVIEKLEHGINPRVDNLHNLLRPKCKFCKTLPLAKVLENRLQCPGCHKQFYGAVVRGKLRWVVWNSGGQAS